MKRIFVSVWKAPEMLAQLSFAKIAGIFIGSMALLPIAGYFVGWLASLTGDTHNVITAMEQAILCWGASAPAAIPVCAVHVGILATLYAWLMLAALVAPVLSC
jgi:hypothetical protein